jgi:serine/threonine protein kinase
VLESASELVDEFKAGQVLDGKFEIIGHVSSGGFGSIYKVRQMHLDRLVALKILHTEVVDTEDGLKRFQREAKAASAFSHENLAMVYEFGLLKNGRPYIVMPLIDGETLKERIKRKGFLGAEEALPILLQLCKGLSFAHNHDVIHRDIKPANILIVTNDRGEEVIKLIDFGLSRPKGNWAQNTGQLTQAGQTVGSPLYMSPEQCRGKEVNVQSDIYSLGCTMYEMFCGHPPFVDADTVLTLMSRHVNDEPPEFEVNAQNSNDAQRLRLIVLRCLRKQPDERYANVSDLIDDLRSASISSTLIAVGEQHATNSLQNTVPVIPVSTKKKKNKSPIAVKPNALTVVSALLLLAISFWIYRGFVFNQWGSDPTEVVVDFAGAHQKFIVKHAAKEDTSFPGILLTRQKKYEVAYCKLDKGAFDVRYSSIEPTVSFALSPDRDLYFIAKDHLYTKQLMAAKRMPHFLGPFKLGDLWYVKDGHDTMFAQRHLGSARWSKTDKSIACGSRIVVGAGGTGKCLAVQVIDISSRVTREFLMALPSTAYADRFTFSPDGGSILSWDVNNGSSDFYGIDIRDRESNRGGRYLNSPPVPLKVMTIPVSVSQAQFADDGCLWVITKNNELWCVNFDRRTITVYTMPEQRQLIDLSVEK